MKIIKFKKLKNGQYKLILETKEEILTFENVILKNDLLIHPEVDEEIYDKILEDNKEEEAYNTLLKYLSHHLRSRKECEIYLEKKNYSSHIISSMIEKFQSQGYLNDERYIQAYINDKMSFSSLGPYKIRQELLKQVKDEKMIDKYINNLDLELIGEKLDKIITKLIKNNHQKSGSVLKNKIYQYLVTLGYPKEMIVSSLNKHTFPVNKQNLQNDYQKLLKKYQNKYDDDKLKYVISQKLLLKGYTKNEINDVI